MKLADAVHERESVTVTLYDPALRLPELLPVLPLLQSTVYGEVPPFGFT